MPLCSSVCEDSPRTTRRAVPIAQQMQRIAQRLQKIAK